MSIALVVIWVVIFHAHFACRDILMLGKSMPIKWRQHPYVTIAVYWDVKHQFKQTNMYVDMNYNLENIFSHYSSSYHHIRFIVRCPLLRVGLV